MKKLLFRRAQRRAWGGGIPHLNALKVATQFNLLCSSTQTISLPKSVACSRVPHKIGGGDVTHLALAFESCFLASGSTGNTAALGNSYTVDSAVIEYNGVAVPLTFDGGNSTKLVPDAMLNILTDELNIQDAFGIPFIPYDATIWVKCKITLPNVANPKLQIASRNSETLTPTFLRYDTSANNLSDPTAPGAWTAPGASFDTYGYTPIVLGRHTSINAVSVLAHGDSITAGSNDSGKNPSGYGWFSRILSEMAVVPSFLNLSVGGSTLLAGNVDDKLLPYYGYANFGVSAGGTNDFTSSGVGQTVATALSRQNIIRTRMKNQGMRKVGVMCTLPMSTSTDGWSTVANQTTRAGWGAGGRPEEYNNALKSGGYDFVILNDSIRAATDVYKFKAPPTTASDGVHPNATGYALMQAESQLTVESAITSALTPVAYTSVATGNWNDTTKWTPAGVPTELDSVTISAGHTITVPSGFIAKHKGLTLTGTSGNLATITSTGGKIECHGNITRNAFGVITEGSTISLNGFTSTTV